MCYVSDPLLPSSYHCFDGITIAGALDVTEEVGVALGIPHVAQIWDEVHRSHSKSRSRSRSRSAILEVSSVESVCVCVHICILSPL